MQSLSNEENLFAAKKFDRLSKSFQPGSFYVVELKLSKILFVIIYSTVEVSTCF